MTYSIHELFLSVSTHNLSQVRNISYKRCTSHSFWQRNLYTSQICNVKLKPSKRITLMQRDTEPLWVYANRFHLLENVIFMLFKSETKTSLKKARQYRWIKQIKNTLLSRNDRIISHFPYTWLLFINNVYGIKSVARLTKWMFVASN